MPNQNYSDLAPDRKPVGAKEVGQKQTVGGKDLKYTTPENLPATEHIKMKDVSGLSFKSLEEVIPDS